MLAEREKDNAIESNSGAGTLHTQHVREIRISKDRFYFYRNLKWEVL